MGDYLTELAKVLNQIPLQSVNRAVSILLDTQMEGRTVYILGNGGSASTASHFACDLSKATIVNDKARIKVISLTDNVALLTAWANDTDILNVFAQQIRNLVTEGDIVIAISASGNSPNVIKAVKAAQEIGAHTIGLTGFDGGALSVLVDRISVPSFDYGIVEDAQSRLSEHAITAAIHNTLQMSDILVEPLSLASHRKRRMDLGGHGGGLARKLAIGSPLKGQGISSAGAFDDLLLRA